MKLRGVLALLQTFVAAAYALHGHGEEEVRHPHDDLSNNSSTLDGEKNVADAVINSTQPSLTLSPRLETNSSDVAPSCMNQTTSTASGSESPEKREKRLKEKVVKTLFGGRHNDSIPQLGGYRASVALVLQTREDETEQLQGCIAISIAPRFFITRASCVRDQESTSYLFLEAAGTTTSKHKKNKNASSPSSTTKPGASERHPVKIRNTTAHPDYFVNLAIVEVDDDRPMAANAAAPVMEPMALVDVSPKYYEREDKLSLVSIDNIFNPSLAKNPQSIQNLIRVPVGSCSYSSSDDAVNCYAPAEFKSRELSFEFGQGMVLFNSRHLVGLPDCEGLCSGGMFYSATHLARFREWIDETTEYATRWISPDRAGRSIFPVAPEQEPTYVSLLASSSPDAKPVCGGALIAPRFVLTTASCAGNHTLSSVRIGHGERSYGRHGHEDIIPTATVAIHPQFANFTQFSNDLAIVQLSGPTFYTPTILASDDALHGTNASVVHAVGTGKPRRSVFDESIMCLPPQHQKKNHDSEKLSSWELLAANDDETAPGGEDKTTTETVDVSVLQTDDAGVNISSNPVHDDHQQPMNIEQWNTIAGDAVLDVPSEATYYLLGISLALHDSTTTISTTAASTGNASQSQPLQRPCSLNETVGDDDNAALVMRLATRDTIAFIDSVSVDHTWFNPHQLAGGGMESTKLMRAMNFDRTDPNDASRAAALGTFKVSYDGPLEFEKPPPGLDLGFVVGLRIEKYGQNYCGGSLIAASYVLTAAHCVAGDRAKFVSVGSHESAGAETEVIAVKHTNVITHPSYGKRSLYSYDIAVLELESQAYPKPIVMDNSHKLNPSMYLTLFGYGADSASSTELSNVMRSVDLPFFARDKCKNMFPELDESMFCAGGELARDACTGDSGSPLVRIVQGKPLLVGVVSSGRNGCGTPGVPGVYALVAQVQAFVDSVVAGNKWVMREPTAASPSSSSSSSSKRPSGRREDSSTDETRQKDSDTESSPPTTTTTTTTTTKTSSEDSAVLRSPAVNMTDLPFEIINMANGSVHHQLSIVEMTREMPQRLQVAVMEFLVGDYEYVSGWEPQMDRAWTMAFYSTGDLTGLMKIVAKHRAKPLYARKNRFVRPTNKKEMLSQRSCGPSN